MYSTGNSANLWNPGATLAQAREKEANFGHFVVTSMKLLAMKLNEAAVYSAVASPAVASPIEDEPKFVEPKSCSPVAGLDITGAERNDIGTIIFPDTASGREADWCIFVRDDTNDFVYRLQHKIGMDLQASDFVKQAYATVLLRSADPGGEATYTTYIETHHLTRREVIATLANSSEALEKGLKLLIIPYPSSWMTAIGYEPDVAGPFDVAIKY